MKKINYSISGFLILLLITTAPASFANHCHPKKPPKKTGTVCDKNVNAKTIDYLTIEKEMICVAEGTKQWPAFKNAKDQVDVIFDAYKALIDTKYPKVGERNQEREKLRKIRRNALIEARKVRKK